MKEKLTRVTLNLIENDLKLLSRLAENDFSSLSQIIRKIIRTFVLNQKK